MKNKIIYLFMVLFLVSCGSSSTSSLAPDSPKGVSSSKVTGKSILPNIDEGKYKEGEILVKFKPGIAAASVQAHQIIGAELIKRIPLIDVDHVRLPEGLTVKDAIAQYMQDPNVEYAEPNYLLRVAETIPNDTFFSPQQWALRNTGQYADGTAGADIKASGAWDITKGNNTVLIAVVDSGIDRNHLDLFDNVVSGFNFIDNNTDTADEIAHGTHVAGIIGAVGNNALGMSGLMWDVRLMPLKVCRASNDCPQDAVAGAITYAVSQGAKVINVSLGTFPGNPSPSVLFDAVNAAMLNSVLVIASVGNEANNNDLAPVFPASYAAPYYGGLANVISVAATDQNDRLASFSSFGNSVHVAAPGVYVLSTVPFVELGSPLEGFIILDSGYAFFSGTSMAAPHVSGLAGLLYSFYDGIHNTQFTYWQVRDAILWSADPLTALQGKVMTGGRINAYKALSSLLTPTNLKAEAVSPGQISLTWSGNATGEQVYVIERKTGSESFQWLINIPRISRDDVIPQPPVAYTFVDTNLSASTSYTYRVKAYSDKIGCTPLHGTCIPGNSFYSNEASATTLSAGAPSTSSSGGGGGGCSIGARQNAPTAMADLAILLMPLLVIAIARRKR